MARVKGSSLVLLFLLGAFRIAQAQQSFSVPRSDKLIDLELTLPGNAKVARVSVREGVMAKIRDTSIGYNLALIVTLDKSSSRAKFTLLEITNRADSGEQVQKLGDIRDVGLGETASIDSPKGKLEVAISNISSGEFTIPALVDPLRKQPSPTELRKIYGKSGGDCCVTCDDTTVCAHSVKLDCGSCDSGLSGNGKFPVM